jgi:hypothetical protein
MPIISWQIITKSVPAIAGLKLLNDTDHYGLEHDVRYLASEGPGIDTVLTARVATIGAGGRTAGIRGVA